MEIPGERVAEERGCWREQNAVAGRGIICKVARLPLYCPPTKMRLKRLELQGYKTFASKTVFEFDAGITAIVGPNGSGKSNVADAMRWVLGEQSYSTLRGKRTTDMIFAGSQERARAGMAQAILTLDNSDGWLPIDYAEVTIGRRAFRSGENEYLINGQQVRLRDVQELLATSGLAERTYTIVGQGLVDQALSLRAEERRALFEEAAGISHYQARRATTLRRLQETERNLERVHDILSEIRPRLGGLKRQANRARNYEQVQADLRHLLRIWYGYQWEDRKRKLRAQRLASQEAEGAWKESRQRLAKRQDTMDGLRREIGRLQRQIAEKEQERERLRERREQARRQVAVLGERQTLLKKQVAEIEADLPRLEGEQARARQETDEALSQLESAQERLAQQQETLRRFNQAFEAQQMEIDRWRNALAERERAQEEAQRTISQAEGQLSQLEERWQERDGETGTTEMAEVTARIEKLAEVAAAAEARVAALNEQRQRLQQAQETAKRELKALRREEGELNRQVNAHNKEVARLEARCDLLNQMREKEVTVPAGVETVGRVAGLVRIPPEHQAALEAALGARLATLVVADEAALWQLLAANGPEEKVWATAVAATRPPARPALSVNGEGPVAPEDVIGWAAELVETEAAPAAVVDLLFGPVLLVRSREAAFAVGRELPAGCLAVTPEGFVVHAGGLVEAGRQDAQRSILAREEAWREAQKVLAAEQEATAAAQAAAAAQAEAVAERQAELNELAQEERRLGRLAGEANQRLAKAQRDLDRAEQQRDFLQRQEEVAARQREQLQQRIARTKETLAGRKEEVVRLESRVGEARAELEALPVAEAEQQRQNRRQEIETARTIVAGRQAVVESRRATLNQIEAQLRRQQERRQNFLRQAEQLDLGEAAAELAGLQEAMVTVDEALAPLRQRLDEKQAAVEEVADEMSAIQRQTHDLETHYTQMKVALSQRENELEGLIERIRNDLGLVVLEFDEEQAGQTPLPIGEIVDQLPSVAELPEDIEETIQNYRGQLHRIGSVNPEAPAEYEETQERYEFLTQQVEDLQKTEKRLRKVIADLDEMTSRAFAATVKKVDEVFGEMFQRLFAGGSARLVLTDPDNLTESGVDIIARLPNRRQQRLALLSGGERSLTAAALIFALLQVSPPPFSALDEVDAMLDEANVTRFRAVLRELAANTQFIVITHNRGTVQVAKTVYGISMGNDSASQVISIRPDEYVNRE